MHTYTYQHQKHNYKPENNVSPINKELEQMILSRIRAFESKHGPISIVKED